MVMGKSLKNISLAISIMILLFSSMNVNIVHCRNLRPAAGADIKSDSNQGSNGMQQSSPVEKVPFSGSSSSSSNDSNRNTTTSSFVRSLRYILASGPSRRGAGH